MSTNSTKSTKKQDFLEVYKASKCNISKACEAINIDRGTFYIWKEKYPKFAITVEEIEDSLDDKIEGVLFRNAETGRQRAVEFWLINHKKDKYTNTQRNEIDLLRPLIIEVVKHYDSTESDNRTNQNESGLNTETNQM